MLTVSPIVRSPMRPMESVSSAVLQYELVPLHSVSRPSRGGRLLENLRCLALPSPAATRTKTSRARIEGAEFRCMPSILSRGDAGAAVTHGAGCPHFSMTRTTAPTVGDLTALIASVSSSASSAVTPPGMKFVSPGRGCARGWRGVPCPLIANACDVPSYQLPEVVFDTAAAQSLIAPMIERMH